MAHNVKALQKCASPQQRLVGLLCQPIGAALSLSRDAAEDTPLHVPPAALVRQTTREGAENDHHCNANFAAEHFVHCLGESTLSTTAAART